MKRIAIIGGGFTGAIAAVHAMRAGRLPLQIDIVEPRPGVGAGLAYSTSRPEHRLNVPSRRMIVFDEEPSHFHEWFVRTGLDRADPASDGGNSALFASRRDFARYLEELLDECQRAARPPCTLRHLQSRAISLAKHPDGSWRIGLADGAELAADAVLVCIGHTGTVPPAPFDDPSLLATGRVLSDPWNADAIAGFGSDARILILGQGLTMGDVLSSLEVQQHRGPVVAVSRRGLLARAYADSVKTPVPFEALRDDARGSEVIRLMRQACDEAVRAGHSWNSVIETTRERGAGLWRRLSAGEQCRLIRHARIFWDAHRYRMAPQVAGAIDRAQAEGRLTLLAGRVVAATPARTADGGVEGIDVHIRRHPRDRAPDVLDRFDLVVSCVGPTHDVAKLENPFIQSLLARGFAEAHPTRLGFVVGEDNRFICDGRATPGVYLIGPLSRGACGDIVGAPEISRQARTVVASALEQFEGRAGAGNANGLAAPPAAA